MFLGKVLQKGQKNIALALVVEKIVNSFYIVFFVQNVKSAFFSLLESVRSKATKYSHWSCKTQRLLQSELTYVLLVYIAYR